MPTKEGECQPKLKRKKKKKKRKGAPPKKNCSVVVTSTVTYQMGPPRVGTRIGEITQKNKNQDEMLFFISGELIGGDTQMRGVGVGEGWVYLFL